MKLESSACPYSREHTAERPTPAGTYTHLNEVTMTSTKMSKSSLRATMSCLLVAGTLVSSGCALSNKAKGAIIGTSAGAAAGAVVGSQTGSTARGAIIGAVVGGAAGTIIGRRMDQQATEIAQAIPGATVTRVGEGMVVTFASGLLYDTDSDAIRPDAAANLRNLAESLKKYGDTNLLIVGHTDDQ